MDTITELKHAAQVARAHEDTARAEYRDEARRQQGAPGPRRTKAQQDRAVGAAMMRVRRAENARIAAEQRLARAEGHSYMAGSR